MSIMLKNRHYPSKALTNYVLRARHDHRLSFTSLDGSRNVLKIALLIDGENTDDNRHTAKFIEEAGRLGDITMKKLYADFTTPQMADWNQKIVTYALDPVHRSSPSPESALIIDAMDILHSHKVDGFCIVSSNNKYTGLAIRLRNAGLFVLGIGRPQTPECFVNACQKFIYSEKEEVSVKKINTMPSKSMVISKCDQVFTTVVDKDTGHALASRLCAKIFKLDRNLEYRSLGYASVGTFCESLRPKYVTFLGGVDNNSLFVKLNENYVVPDLSKIEDRAASNEAVEGTAAGVDHAFDQDTTTTTTTSTIVSDEIISDAEDTSVNVAQEDQLPAEIVVEDRTGLGYGHEDVEDVLADKSAHMKLVNRAFQAADRDSNGAVSVTSFWRTLSKLDHLFDYRKLGFLTFIEFCNSLQPEYISFVGGVKGNLQYIRRNKKSGLDVTQLPKRKVQAAPVVDNQNHNAVSNATVDSSEGKSPYVRLLDRVFQIDKYNRIIDLEYLQRTLKAWDPLFDHRKLGFSSFLNFCRAFQPEYTIFPSGNGSSISLMQRNSSNHQDNLEGAAVEEDLLAKRRAHIELVDRAFKIGDNRGKRRLEGFLVNLRQIDQNFSYRNLGFSRFIDLCETLQPEYVVSTGGTNNSANYIERNSSLMDSQKANEAVEPLASKRPYLLELVGRAFNINNHSGKMLIGRLFEILKQVDPLFSHKNLHFKKFIDFCRTLEPEYVLSAEVNSTSWFIERNTSLLESSSTEKGYPLASRRTYLELVGRAFRDYPTRIINLVEVVESLRESDPHFDISVASESAFQKSLEPYYVVFSHGKGCDRAFYLAENSEWVREKFLGQLVGTEMDQTIESSESDSVYNLSPPPTLDIVDEKDLSTSDEVEEEKEKEVGVLTDKSFSKRPLSSFNTFSREVAPQIIKEFPGITAADRFKEIGRRWQSLTAEEKLAYKGRVILVDKAEKQLNSYNSFVREIAPQFPGITAADRFKEIGRRWQSLTAEEKLAYKRRVNPTDNSKLADLHSENTSTPPHHGELLPVS
eukprot:gene28804-37811_t